MKRHCTIPAIFGFRHWFETKFGKACLQHDKDYLAQRITRKRADIKMFAYMVNKGYPMIAIIAYGFNRAFGWLYWHDIIGGSNTED